MLGNRRALAMHLSRLIRISPRPNPAAAAIAAAQYISSLPAPPRLPLKVGDVLRETRQFSAADVAAYAAVSGDQNPVHLHPDFACRVAGFDGGAVVHGMLVASLFPSIIASNFFNKRREYINTEELEYNYESIAAPSLSFFGCLRPSQFRLAYFYLSFGRLHHHRPATTIVDFSVTSSTTPNNLIEDSLLIGSSTRSCFPS